MPGAAEAIKTLEAKGARILYVTNNSGLTSSDYVSKLQKMGFDAVAEQIVTSGQAAADYCAENGYRRILLVGEPGLVRTFVDNGLEVVNAGPDGSVVSSEAPADVVVSGICREALSYSLLNSAMQVALQTGRYVACNQDLTYPIEGGRFCPGSGSIVAAIEACSGVKSILVGKPNPLILSQTLARIGVDPQDTLMVGDRMDTDIECGKAAGCDTALVLTGVMQDAVEGQWTIQSVVDLL